MRRIIDSIRPLKQEGGQNYRPGLMGAITGV